MFHRDAEQAESWIALREAMLGNEDEDLGVRKCLMCMCMWWIVSQCMLLHSVILYYILAAYKSFC